MTSSDATLTSVTLANAIVTGNNRVGKLVGFSAGQLKHQVQPETLPASQALLAGWLVIHSRVLSIAESFATGDITVTNVMIAGGLVGAHLNGTITASYARGDVDAENTVGGLVGSNVGETSNSYWDEAASE